MDELRSRKGVIVGLFVSIVLVFVIRIFYLQVLDDTYEQLAEDNIIRKITVYPARGLVYDRNRELIIYNEAVYDLMVVPFQVEDIDTALFCKLLGIDNVGMALFD